MQLSLTLRGLVQAATLVACLAVAHAENKFDLTTSYFLEPGKATTLHVIRPEVDISGDAAKWLTLRAGYDVDIVAGATPRIYGSSADAISSATSFTDYRHSAHAGAEVRIGPTSLDVNYTYGSENDYRSHSIDATAKVDLWGKNTTFKLGYSHNWDTVCDADNRGATPLERHALSSSKGCFDSKAVGLTTQSLAMDSYFAAWSQVLSPIATSDLSITMQSLNGFQSNPYRLVRLFGSTVDAQESEPTLRQRMAAQLRLRFAIKKLRAALGLLGRYYWDTWAIQSATIEATWDQYLSQKLIIRFRGRFYQQSRALFYRDAGEALSYESVGPVGQYFTGDRELSPFRNWLVGIKLSWTKTANEKGKIAKVFDALDLNAKCDLMFYEALTPLPPNSQRLLSPVNAIILQLGLTLRW